MQAKRTSLSCRILRFRPPPIYLPSVADRWFLASQAAKPITLSQGEELGVCSKEDIQHYSFSITYLRNLRSKKTYRIPSEKPRILTFFHHTNSFPTRQPSDASLFHLFSEINFYLSELFRGRKKVPFCFSELTQKIMTLTESGTVLKQSGTTLTLSETTLTRSETMLTRSETVLTDLETTLTDLETTLTRSETTLTE